MTISAENVCWAAGRRMIVDGVSVTVQPGEMLGLLGPNGSGKSTLLRLICRLRKVGSGIITLDGRNIDQISRAHLARRVALVEQQATTDGEVSVVDVVKLGRTPHRSPLTPWTDRDDAAVESALRHVGMGDKRGQLWHTLSGGERQRVHIARALAQTPTELLLDEPTNHLDIQHQLEILALVGKLPVTSIVALHDLNLAAIFCDRLVVLKAGKVVAAGTPDEVLTEELIWSVFGVRAMVGSSPNHGRRHIQFLMDARSS
jgi:iron complex transport system ATP-binding protein